MIFSFLQSPRSRVSNQRVLKPSHSGSDEAHTKTHLENNISHNAGRRKRKFIDILEYLVILKGGSGWN